MTLPNFLIIGGCRCGSTSLYFDLVEHPKILPTKAWKEISYFDFHWDKSIGWYRDRFPNLNKGQITGEATCNYIQKPECAERIYKIIPKVKMVAILRNPVDRAISHHFMYVRLWKAGIGIFVLNGRTLPWKREKTLDEAIDDELAGRLKNPYLSRIGEGYYAEYLKSYYKYFPKKQIFIIQAEKYWANPRPIYADLLKFLGVPNFTPKKFRHRNPYRNLNKNDVGKGYYQVSQKTRKRLIKIFKPHNQELYKLLGYKMEGWDR